MAEGYAISFPSSYHHFEWLIELWYRTLASAVVIPDQDSDIPSPEHGAKRRQSSTADPDSDIKRRRLSAQDDNQDSEQPPARRPSSPKAGVSDSERRRNRRDEERKRGQRLFGSLLGTLSQSSNSAAQRRRADIERKQQDKLKIQDEEYGELKKKRREDRLALRKKEQKLYEKEMVGFLFLQTELGESCC